MVDAAWGYWSCSFSTHPCLVGCAWKPFADSAAAAAVNSNFLKGVQWAPDGSCGLTASDDNRLRVFDTPPAAYQDPPAASADAEQPAAAASTNVDAGVDAEQRAAAGPAAGSDSTDWQPAVQVHAGETVYDYCWFTAMSALEPASCCFASTSRGQPIKLWDAVSGVLRASYRGYDDADEVTAAYSLAFNPGGSLLLGGYTKCIRVFDVGRPGRDCLRLMTHKKRQDGSIPGIISCLAFNPQEPDLLAAGSYSRCMGLFDTRTREQLLWLEGHAGGITQVLFSPDGNYLYSGARRDSSIHCWDIRATGQVVYSMMRPTATTNQRISFSIEACGRHLATGGCDGCVRVFDLMDGQQVASFQAADDTINGVSINPRLPLLATASGHRRYPLLPADGWEADEPSAAPEQPHSSSAVGGQSLAVGADVITSGKAGGDVDGVQLSMSSLRPGGPCNSLRLWRVQGVWVPYPAEPAAAAEAVGAVGSELHPDL